MLNLNFVISLIKKKSDEWVRIEIPESIPLKQTDWLVLLI